VFEEWGANSKDGDPIDDLATLELLRRQLDHVDLCLRLRLAGWRVGWTPFAELLHRESVTLACPPRFGSP